MTSTDTDLSQSQLRSVLVWMGIAVALALTVPVYYTTAALFPGVAKLIPPMTVHVAMAVGIGAVFPGTMVYAHLLEHRADKLDSGELPDYGVNDRWEQENL